MISDSHICTPPHPTLPHPSVKGKLVSDRQRPQYPTCCYQNVARLVRDLMLAVALCGRFESNTFLRNDGNYMTNDTSSATPTEHIKIPHTIRYKPHSQPRRYTLLTVDLLTTSTKLTAAAQYLLQLALLSVSSYELQLYSCLSVRSSISPMMTFRL